MRQNRTRASSWKHRKEPNQIRCVTRMSEKAYEESGGNKTTQKMMQKLLHITIVENNKL